MPSIICGMPQSTNGLCKRLRNTMGFAANKWTLKKNHGASSAREQFNGGTQHDKLRENYWL